MKKILLPLLGLLCFSFCKDKEAEGHKPKNMRSPNIILIMADDQGWGDLSFTGNTNLHTPHIDALAKNGVSFENFYVQPVCSPTRAELLTGQYFTRVGVYETSSGGERMDAKAITLADILKKEGYATAAYGKWHNGTQPPYHPNSRGFDDFYGFASGHWGNYFSPMLERNGKIVQGEGFLTNDLTDKALQFIKNKRDSPFFLYLPYNTPHSPMQVPDAYWQQFAESSLQKTHKETAKENVQFTKAALAMVKNIDDNVGRVMQSLKELELEENTIVIYLSDNGPNGWRYNGGMRGKKGHVDEGGVRTPFFMQWKNKIPPGATVNQIASALDILPTLAGLSGIELDKTMALHGKDISPLLFSQKQSWQDRLLYNHWNGKTSVRSQRFRLDNEDRLYDIETDRGQQTDISQKFPKMRDSLKSAKKAWVRKTISVSSENDDRAFTLGHPDYTFTQLPARDGVASGTIKRSNIYPNDTFFSQWTSSKDSITWDVNVLADGLFEVQVYYACSKNALGAVLELRMGDHQIKDTIKTINNAPLTGMENDRVARKESYVKDFISMDLGKIQLTKGRGTLTLKAVKVPMHEVADIRLLQFKKVR